MIPKKIILHCSASPNGKPVSIDEIRSWHLARGFRDVGYHLVIDVDGTVSRGRGLNEPGAHCEGENHDSIGICLVGTDRFTRAQFESLRHQLDGLFMNYHSVDPWELRAHHEFPSAARQGKTCPNIPAGWLVYWYHLQDDQVVEPLILI